MGANTLIAINKRVVFDQNKASRVALSSSVKEKVQFYQKSVVEFLAQS